MIVREASDHAKSARDSFIAFSQASSGGNVPRERRARPACPRLPDIGGPSRWHGSASPRMDDAVVRRPCLAGIAECASAAPAHGAYGRIFPGTELRAAGARRGFRHGPAPARMNGVIAFGPGEADVG